MIIVSWTQFHIYLHGVNTHLVGAFSVIAKPVMEPMEHYSTRNKHHCHCVQSLASPESVVSCTTAGYICMAEPGCQTALTYYHTNCRAMFEGGSALAF